MGYVVSIAWPLPIVKKEENKLNSQKEIEEIMKIAMALKENTLLYQVMKTAKELNSVEPLIEAANFLKGAKKNED